MISESTQKQLLLVGGILGAVSGIIGSIGTIIGAFKKIAGLPPLATWVVYGAIFLLGVWMLVKWSTRHSRLLKPDALTLERDNAEHLVGRADDIDNLFHQCLTKQVVFLEGESGSGKSALVRSGLFPKLKDDKSVLPLLLGEGWIDGWDRTAFVALKNALITCGAVGSDVTAKSTDGQLQTSKRHISTLADAEQTLIRLNDEESRIPLIIFDQFDDYQARNRERLLPGKIWLDPATLRQSNHFWDMVARLLEQDKLHCLFVTRSDTAGGLSSVEFVGSRSVFRLDRVRSAYIAELLRRLTEGTPAAPVIANPDAGWTRLSERIIRDISEQDVILPQQLNTVLRGIQSLKRLNVKQYERVGGAAGIEAFYVEQRINRTARTLDLGPGQVRAMLVALIDPSNPTKTRSLEREDLLAAAAKGNRQQISADKLDEALEDLEQGEIVRCISDQERSRTTFRLDHDYLTRGVSAANERAGRWHYFLEERAKGFQNAGTLWKKWKALLPVGTQCRLAWERVRGRFRYGSRRGYALWSLARFLTRIVSVILTFYLVFVLLILGMWSAGFFGSERLLASINSSLKNIQSTTDSALIRSEMDQIVRSVGALEAFEREEAFQGQALAVAGKVIEQMQTSTNTDQMDALTFVLSYFAGKLRPEEAEMLAGSILAKFQSTMDTAQLNALTRAFAATSFHLQSQKAWALAAPIKEAIKRERNSDQRHAMGLALAAIASQLNAEEAGMLDSTIVEAMQGEQTVPLLPDADERRPTPKTGKPGK